jgi:AraC-like DNA-binding protein
MPPVQSPSWRVPGVLSLHHYDVHGFPSGEHIGLPSAAITVVIPLDPPLDLSMPGAPRRRMASCVAGLHDAPATIHHDGTQRGLQLAVTPPLLRRLFGVPAAAVAGQAVEFADLMSDRVARRLLDRVGSAPTWPARRALLAAELLARLSDSSARPLLRPEVARAWSLLVASGGTARISEVAAGVGWSARHLTQQFVAALGATPKTVARIVRFQRSVQLVRAGHELAAVAACCHYADQAHMTREWTRLAGAGPAGWIRSDVFANVQDIRRESAR